MKVLRLLFQKKQPEFYLLFAYLARSYLYYLNVNYFAYKYTSFTQFHNN